VSPQSARRESFKRVRCGTVMAWCAAFPSARWKGRSRSGRKSLLRGCEFGTTSRVFRLPSSVFRARLRARARARARFLTLLSGSPCGWERDRTESGSRARARTRTHQSPSRDLHRAGGARHPDPEAAEGATPLVGAALALGAGLCAPASTRSTRRSSSQGNGTTGARGGGRTATAIQSATFRSGTDHTANRAQPRGLTTAVSSRASPAPGESSR
jgi:hypothetical protein